MILEAQSSTQAQLSCIFGAQLGSIEVLSCSRMVQLDSSCDNKFRKLFLRNLSFNSFIKQGFGGKNWIYRTQRRPKACFCHVGTTIFFSPRFLVLLLTLNSDWKIK